MFERGNELRLAGLFRQRLTSNASEEPVRSSNEANATNGGNNATSSNDDAIDYSRCFNGSSKQQILPDSSRGSTGEVVAEAAAERFRRSNSLVFRPESAPTVLDMSPENSLSGPPSVRTLDLSESHDGEMHGEDIGKKIFIFL